MNKSAYTLLHSPALAGLFVFLMLSGCAATHTPEQVTQTFWNALSEGDVEKAKRYATEDSRELVSKQSQQELDKASVETGQIIIDGNHATVETVLHAGPDTETFLTVLAQEDGQWKVDYRQTLNNLSGNLFGDFLKSLKNLGEKLNEHLEQQLPKIEQELESLGNELEKQIDQFGDELENNFPPEQPGDGRNTI